TLNRTAIRFAGNWNVGAECSFPIRNVELPANPEECETLFQQETVTEMGSILRIWARSGKVEESQHTFVAAIRYFIKYGAVTAIQFLRFDDVKVGREFYLPGTVLRRFVDVRNDQVRAVAGIHCKVNLARELLVRSRRTERFGLKKIGARLYFYS